MAQQRNIKKVVLAYSGGLDTSVILKWLQVNYGCEVITMTADVGQEDDLNGVDEKALRTGATKAYIEDLREEFAKDFIFPMLRSGALYEGRYLLGTSVARPLITKRLVEIARAEGADAPRPRQRRPRVTTRSASSCPPPPSRLICSVTPPARMGSDVPYRPELSLPNSTTFRSPPVRSTTAWTATCSIAASKAASLKIRGKNPSKPPISWPSRSRRPLMKPNTSPSPSNTATRSR